MQMQTSPAASDHDWVRSQYISLSAQPPCIVIEGYIFIRRGSFLEFLNFFAIEMALKKY